MQHILHETLLKSVSKKLLSGLLALAMVLTLVAVPVVDAQAAAISKNGYKLTNKTSVEAGASAVRYNLTGVKKGTKVTVLVTSGTYVGKTKTAASAASSRKITLTGTGKTLKFYVKVPSTYTKTKANVKVTIAKTSSKAKTVLKDTYSVTTTEETAAEVTISDISGLQTDGTGLVGDTLELSYGSDYGTATQITWYRGEKLLSTTSGNASTLNSANGLRLTSTVTSVPGEYYAVVTNASGVVTTTNKITLTKTEQSAVIKSFSITDDYKTGVTKTSGATSISYSTSDTFAVATLTLNREYDGNVYIYAATDTTFTSRIGVAVMDTGVTGGNLGFTAVDADELTEKNATAKYTGVATTNQGIKTQNEDGSVTYMWVVGNTAVTRGKSYVVVFDQENIDTDTIGDGSENKSSAATAPYLTAVAKIAVTKAAGGSAPEITMYDESGNVLTWLGNTTAVNSIFTGLNVYENTSKTTTASHSAGVTNLSTVTKGVITGNSNLTAAGTYSWYYATATTVKGIFSDSATTLTSEYVSETEKAADTVTLGQDKDTATTAEVKFTNARCSGTVYILTAAKYAAVTNDSEVVSNAQASATVSKGDSKVLVENALDSVGTYRAVFIPDDTTAYSRVDSAAATIAQKATTLKMDSASLDINMAAAGTVTVTGLVAYDQYGAKMTTAVGPFTATAEVINIDGTTAEKITTATYTVNTSGVITLTVNYTNAATTTACDKMDGFKLTVLGSEITVQATNAIGAGATGTNLFTVKVDGSEATYSAPALTSYAVGSAAVTSGTASANNLLIGVDQYGNTIAVTALTPAASMTKGVGSAATATIAWTASGAVTISASLTGTTNIAVGDTFTYVLGTGQTLTATCSTASTEGAIGASTSAQFTLTIN